MSNICRIFKPGPGTYAPAERLRALYEAALAGEDVVALSIATRPIRLLTMCTTLCPRFLNAPF